MKTEQKGNVIPSIAGAAFLLLAFDGHQHLLYGSSFILPLYYVAYAALVVLVFMQKRTMLQSILIAIIVLLQIINLFFSLRYLGNIGILIRLIDILAAILLLLLASIALIDSLSQSQEKIKQLSFLPTVINTLSKYKEKAKQFWFIPASLKAVSTLFVFLNPLGYGWLSFVIFLVNVMFIVSYAFTSRRLAYPDDIPTAIHHTSGGTNVNGQVMGAAYCDLVKHILLLLFTFGIYYFIWIYRATAYLNCVDDEPPRNPTNKLLLCMFVPFYFIYWIYKSAQRIDRLAVSKGVASDITTLCIILAFFVFIIPPILMQEKMNTIANVENGTVAPQTYSKTTTPKVNIGNADELKKYKELLDSGAITQEEFDAKKKQLLGL